MIKKITSNWRRRTAVKQKNVLKRKGPKSQKNSCQNKLVSADSGNFCRIIASRNSFKEPKFLLAETACGNSIRSRGLSIKYVCKNLGFFTPSPFVRKFTQPPLLRTLTHDPHPLPMRTYFMDAPTSVINALISNGTPSISR